MQANQADVEQRADDENEPGALLELRHGENEDDGEGQEGGEAVHDDAALPVPDPRRQVVLHHAGPGHEEAREHADGVEGDQIVDLRLVDEHEGEGDAGQHQNPVGEGQAMATPGQLARQESVPRHEAGQVREAVEAGVAARVEDQHGGQLHDVEGEVPGGAGAEDRLDLLGDDSG